MKFMLKALVALMTLAVACLLGITLLSGLVWWKTLLFAAACAASGQQVYKLLRIIDRQFSDN